MTLDTIIRSGEGYTTSKIPTHYLADPHTQKLSRSLSHRLNQLPIPQPGGFGMTSDMFGGSVKGSTELPYQLFLFSLSLSLTHTHMTRTGC